MNHWVRGPQKYAIPKDQEDQDLWHGQAWPRLHVGYYSTPVLSLRGDPGKQNSESLEMKSAEGIHCRANLAICQEKRAVLVHLWMLQNTGGGFDSFLGECGQRCQLEAGCGDADLESWLPTGGLRRTENLRPFRAPGVCIVRLSQKQQQKQKAELSGR